MNRDLRTLNANLITQGISFTIDTGESPGTERFSAPNETHIAHTSTEFTPMATVWMRELAGITLDVFRG